LAASTASNRHGGVFSYTVLCIELVLHTGAGCHDRVYPMRSWENSLEGTEEGGRDSAFDLGLLIVRCAVAVTVFAGAAWLIASYALDWVAFR